MTDFLKKLGRGRAALAVFGTAMVIAIGTAVGTQIGNGAFGLFNGDKQLISYSTKEQIIECGGALFIRSPEADAVIAGNPPTPPQMEWSSFQAKHNAVPAGRDIIDVSIQGETARPITLTGINFSTARRPMPPGATFGNPCGGPGNVRFVHADLDQQPVRIVETNENPDSYVGEPSVKPITWPWTVSLTDPVLLELVVDTRACYCTWRAEIPWQSGNKTGTMRIDNAGHGYTVAAGDPLSGPDYLRAPDQASGWEAFVPPTG